MLEKNVKKTKFVGKKHKNNAIKFKGAGISINIFYKNTCKNTSLMMHRSYREQAQGDIP